MKIGLISDTHSYLDDRIKHHLSGCDEIWHAGDVGDISVIEQLEQLAPVYCVYGNIDGQKVRVRFPEHTVFNKDGLRILMIHIAGSLGRYNQKTRDLIQEHRPEVLICGHSHILKIQQDTRFNLIYMNPGAAGRNGFHKVRTLMTFEINGGKMENLNVVELGPRSSKSID